MRNGYRYVFVNLGNGMSPRQREEIADQIADIYKSGKISGNIKGDSYEGRVRVHKGSIFLVVSLEGKLRPK